MKVYVVFNRIQSEFLWGAKRDAKKSIWIKWDVVCSPIERGDLGIKNLEVFNRALVGKWMWRLVSEKDRL